MLLIGLFIVCHGCKTKEHESIPHLPSMTDSVIDVSSGTQHVDSIVFPMQQRVTATMSDSILTLDITVTNLSESDLVVCPSYVSIRRRGPNTVLFAAYGLGSSFDLEPLDQEPRQSYIREPAPETVDLLQVQLVELPAMRSCTFSYEYRHGQRKEIVDAGPWRLYGELGLPALYRADRTAAGVLNRVSYVEYREQYQMREEKATYLAEHVWWSIHEDAPLAYLDAEEQRILKRQKVSGRILEDPVIPVVMVGQR
jgi:hypothetical protein